MEATMVVKEMSFNDVMDSILDDPSSASLKEKQSQLEDELREKMLSGNASEVMRIQIELRSYPAMILATRVAEIKRELVKVENGFKELKRTRQELVDLKREKLIPLEELTLELERLNQEVQAVDMSLNLADEDYIGLTEQRRNLKAEQQELLDTIRTTKMGDNY